MNGTHLGKLMDVLEAGTQQAPPVTCEFRWSYYCSCSKIGTPEYLWAQMDLQKRKACGMPRTKPLNHKNFGKILGGEWLGPYSPYPFGVTWQGAVCGLMVLLIVKVLGYPENIGKGFGLTCPRPVFQSLKLRQLISTGETEATCEQSSKSFSDSILLVGL